MDVFIHINRVEYYYCIFFFVVLLIKRKVFKYFCGGIIFSRLLHKMAEMCFS